MKAPSTRQVRLVGKLHRNSRGSHQRPQADKHISTYVKQNVDVYISKMSEHLYIKNKQANDYSSLSYVDHLK